MDSQDGFEQPVVQSPRISYNGQPAKAVFDQVINEQPLQISLAWADAKTGKSHCEVFTITMRTPGDDQQLTLGLLLSEGQIQSPEQIDSFEFEQPNQLVVHLIEGHQPDLSDMQRRLISQSSCGICGKTSLQSLARKAHTPLDTTAHWLTPNTIKQLPAQLLDGQTLFAQTGGVHGVALFDENARLLSLKEDIGRHNALDKVIGEQCQTHPTIAFGRAIVLVSGRVSFEIVQKAVVAGYPVLVAVGAPSSLAISAARQFDLTLIGFAKAESFNVYHGNWRLTTEKQL